MTSHHGVASASLMSAKCFVLNTPLCERKVKSGPTKEAAPMKTWPVYEEEDLGKMWLVLPVRRSGL